MTVNCLTNPDLIAYIKARIAEIQPQADKLFLEMKQTEKTLEELAIPYKKVRSDWANFYSELELLKRMLPADVVIEETKPPLPF